MRARKHSIYRTEERFLGLIAIDIFLPANYVYRRSKTLFRTNKQEFDGPTPMLESNTLLTEMREYGAVLTVECGGNGHVRGGVGMYGVYHHWHKKSIFWELLYWKDQLLRHNLNDMHIEKNIFVNIMNTVLNVDGKTKNNLKSILDLPEYCFRPNFHVDAAGGPKQPPFRLGDDQKQAFFQWICRSVKFPDGYVSNLNNCVNLEDERFSGMKSHDCHVVMQCLLPFAFAKILPKDGNKAIAGLDLDEHFEYLLLSQAISHGVLQRVTDILNQLPNATTVVEASLQKACSCGQLEIVKELLPRMRSPNPTVSERVRETHCQSLALDIVAGNGNLDIVKELCVNNFELLARAHSGSYGLAIPVVRASNAGHIEVTSYLYENTPPIVLMEDEGYWATCLLLDAIFYGFLDIALDIVDKFLVQDPPLAVTKHPRQRSSPLGFLAIKPELFHSHCDLGFWGQLIYSCIDMDFPTDSEITRPNPYQRKFWTILQSLPKWIGIKQIYELKDRQCNAHNLLQKMCTSLPVMVKDESWKETVYKALLEAVENGNKQFFVQIIKCNPQLLWITESTSGRNLFQLAVKFRKEMIFNLIYSLDDRKVTLLRFYDQEHNNILHIAGHLSPPDQLSKVAGAALNMQRETQWFEEVKSLVSEREVMERNNESMTPRQVFEASHEPLRKEAEEWMKGTATACSFVAALIATVTFQAIFTVPGGTDESLGEPLLLRDSHFMAFIIVDSLSFFASCTSVLIFLSILTARYSFDDFIVSLPRKMILALTILFIAIIAMLIAFTTALFASMRRQKHVLVVTVVPLAYIPAGLFLMLQYPLLKEMISFTYGKGLFERDTKRWF